MQTWTQHTTLVRISPFSENIINIGLCEILPFTHKHTFRFVANIIWAETIKINVLAKLQLLYFHVQVIITVCGTTLSRINFVGFSAIIRFHQHGAGLINWALEMGDSTGVISFQQPGTVSCFIQAHSSSPVMTYFFYTKCLFPVRN